MASLHFEQVDDIGFINVEDIDLGDRMRPIDRAHAEYLGRLMARDGQHVPITVCRLPGATKWMLVVGGHRVVGAQMFDIPMLKAEIIGPDKIERRQREIHENLSRKDLDPIDRANFIAEMVRLAKLRAGLDPNVKPQSVAANARWQKTVKDQSSDASVTMTHAYGFTEEVARQAGLSRETIYRDLLLHSRLAPSLVEQLRRARPDVAANATQLRALAKLEPAQQSKVVSLLLHADMKLGEPAKTVGEAWSRISGKAGAPADAETKRLSTFSGTFARMGLAEKKGALEHLAGMMPAGFRLVGPNDDFTPATEHMATIAKGLDVAFRILVDLAEGENPVEDERIADALGDVQQALMTANSLKKGGKA